MGTRMLFDTAFDTAQNPSRLRGILSQYLHPADNPLLCWQSESCMGFGGMGKEGEWPHPCGGTHPPRSRYRKGFGGSSIRKKLCNKPDSDVKLGTKRDTDG